MSTIESAAGRAIQPDPAWLHSLASSLDRPHAFSVALPLPVALEEIANWVDLAGADAWANSANPASLCRDLDRSLAAIGTELTRHIANEVSAVQSALALLSASPRAQRAQSPGNRTDRLWTGVRRCVSNLLNALESDDAVLATWDDLVWIARDRSLDGRQYRAVADTLHAQIERRGHDADEIFRDLADVLAVRDGIAGVCRDKDVGPIETRLDAARGIVSAPAAIEPIVVWLGYRGRIHQDLSAGNVRVWDALWVIPNARSDGQDFDYKKELVEVVGDGFMFRTAELTDEDSDVDTVIRVDLGMTTVAGAAGRAARVFDIILDVSIHRAGGIRPVLVQSAVLSSGRPVLFALQAAPVQTGFSDDTYGASITTDAVARHGPRIAEALARRKLPRLLEAALDVQTALDRPFSRDMALRDPSRSDLDNVVLLSDRIVQHVAAYAGSSTNDVLDWLQHRLPHARWLSDLRRAGDLCLFGARVNSELRDGLVAEWVSSTAWRPWILFLWERADDLLSVCRAEHERAWITRMLRSIGDHRVYTEVIAEYSVDGDLLESRRRRVRNALAHGNPTGGVAVGSIREYAAYLSTTALHLGLESFFDGTVPADSLRSSTAEHRAMEAGQDAATFWRARTSRET